jgi:hypothetical protein
MFASDSPLLEIDYRRENKIVPYYTVATIFVNNPGDLNDPARMRLLYQMVSELESFPESWGPKSTVLFINDFLSFEQDGDNEEEVQNSTALKRFDTDDLPYFLKWPEYDFWKGFVKLRTEKYVQT